MFVRFNKGHRMVVINTEHISLIEEIEGGVGDYHIYMRGRFVTDLTKKEADALMRCMAYDTRFEIIDDPEE